MLVTSDLQLPETDDPYVFIFFCRDFIAVAQSDVFRIKIIAFSANFKDLWKVLDKLHNKDHNVLHQYTKYRWQRMPHFQQGALDQLQSSSRVNCRQLPL